MTGARAATPLIVTAALPRDLHRWATSLRREHYPPERNVLEAHVTLFHSLPPSLEAEARRELARMGAANRPVPVRLAGLRALGAPRSSCTAPRCCACAMNWRSVSTVC